MESFAFFLPTRRGSERVLDKNTRQFAGIDGGLLRLKLEQLLKTKGEYPIILSTNDEESIKIAHSFHSDRIKVIERPDYLCLSSTNLLDLIKYIPTVIKEDNIVWVHVTEPFVNEEVMDKAIKTFIDHKEKQQCDSLMSVNKIQSFIWSKQVNTFISHDRNTMKWPRSQDLEPLFEVNSAIFINPRENYLKYDDRIGLKPFMYELTKIEALDIDWNDDFRLAELIYENIKKL
ncbi:cytidylyltransferase domain-containing protein [Sphingobacterium sp. Mn56C]|uniref:acylneuraminate cytidylyltransferase family protein n=1 Tax=Sphingobacterium sp. Mn56C TaxID=3395261 RepID=UPI003BDD681B